MSEPIDRFLAVLLPPPADLTTGAGRAQRAAEQTRHAVDRMAADQNEALERLHFAQREARAAQEAGSFRESAQVAELQKQLCATALYCRTLLQLLVEKQVLTVEEFQQRMIDVDMLDGRRDDR
jgi:hypothetical protein